MSFRTFILGLTVSFGVAWLFVVVVPFFKMRDRAPIQLDETADGAAGVFYPKRSGRILNGAEVYAENGCYLCHTQLIRPTYAGNDMYRADWGGWNADPERGDTRRETVVEDFFGEKFAQIGVSRLGPDLSNLGLRVVHEYAVKKDPAQWLYQHLYNPRFEPERWKSNCPPMPFLFDVRDVRGAGSPDALRVRRPRGTEVVPSSDARALVSYLLSMKKDQSLPASMNFNPPEEKKD